MTLQDLPWLVTGNADAPHPQPILHAMFIRRSWHLQNAMTLPTRQMNRFWVSLSLLTSCRLLLTCKTLYLEAQIKNWTSLCYTHFKTPVIVEEKGEVKYQFACRMYVFFFISFFNHASHSRIDRNLSIVLTRKCEEDSTTNLLHHVKSWKVKLSTHQRASQTMHMVQHTARLNSTTLSPCGSSNVTDPSPSSTTSHCNGYYECFMWRWKPHLWQQSPETSKKSIAFRKSKLGRFSRSEYFFLLNWHNLNRYLGHFQKYPGQIHVGFNRWTSPNIFSFLGVVVHTAVEGKLRSFILDFIL